jgi:hypothetical protein
MDQTKDGKFYVQEIVDFAALYSERQLMHSGVTVDFLVRLVLGFFLFFFVSHFPNPSCRKSSKVSVLFKCGT